MHGAGFYSPPYISYLGKVRRDKASLETACKGINEI
jgi:hypothetical protein